MVWPWNAVDAALTLVLFSFQVAPPPPALPQLAEPHKHGVNRLVHTRRVATALGGALCVVALLCVAVGGQTLALLWLMACGVAACVCALSPPRVSWCVLIVMFVGPRCT